MNPDSLFSQTNLVTIEGKIENYKKHVDTVGTIEVFMADFVKEDIIISSKIEPTGSYKISFPLFRTQGIELKYKDFIKLIINPGDRLVVNFHADSIYNTIDIKGDAVVLNMDLIQYHIEQSRYWQKLYQAENGRYKELSQVRLTSNPTKFKEYLYKRLDNDNEFYYQYISTNKVSDTLKRWAKAELEYECANDLISYLVHHETKINFLTENYFDFLNRFKLDNIEASISAQYINYLTSYHNSYFTRRYVSTRPTPSFQSAF